MPGVSSCSNTGFARLTLASCASSSRTVRYCPQQTRWLSSTRATSFKGRAANQGSSSAAMASHAAKRSASLAKSSFIDACRVAISFPTAQALTSAVH